MTKDPGFFVGYFSKVPPAYGRFNLAAGAGLVVLFAVLALLLGRGTDIAGQGQVFSGSEVTMSGTIRLTPYPLLLVGPDSAHPLGRAIMLAGEGKNRPPGLSEQQDLRISGFALQRGSLDMLLVGQVEPFPNNTMLPASTAMGRWRVSGEICDGKCAAGVMHPGTGLAHKACANLCIDGGLPPVLEMRVPVLGTSFLLLANRDGGPVPAAFRDLTALPVELEGEIEQLGDIFVLKADWAQARVL